MLDHLVSLADAQTSSDVLKSNILPIYASLISIATVACILFIIFGGYYYITSTGNPDKLEKAKKTLRNALIGFLIILGAGTFFAIMQNAYTQRPAEPEPSSQIEKTEEEDKCALCEVINQSISSFINGIIQSVGKPAVDIVKQFTISTPLMAQNNSVFNLWMIVVAITNTIFILIITMIGFRVMSSTVIGLGEVDIHSLIPQVLLIFLTSNLSIFVIDTIITISNGMIHALHMGMSNDVVWTTLTKIISGAATVDVGTLLLIAIAIVLAILLLVYYLKRLIILYIGAIVSPLVILLWLLPSFKDFVSSCIKTYIMTIFTLFIQVVVLLLATSLFSSFVRGESNQLITLLLVIATISILLTTNRAMNQLVSMSTQNHGIQKLSNTLIRGMSHITNSVGQYSRKQGMSISRTSVPAISTIHMASSKGISTMTPEIQQTSRQKAAVALVNKNDSSEIIVSGGAKKPNVTVTRIPNNKFKGGSK